LAPTVIVPGEPTSPVATAKAFEPELPGMWRMPSFEAVATSATMSGTGEVEADSRRVSSPMSTGAGTTFVQAKLSTTLVGSNALLGVNAITKLCACLAGISTGVLTVPVSALVVGLVV
jgi:hypothetical protein